MKKLFFIYISILLHHFTSYGTDQALLKPLFKNTNSNFATFKKMLCVRSPTRNYCHLVSESARTGNRTSIGPLISGDGFRYICRHIYDEASLNFQPALVKNGDLVFVSNMFFDDFMMRFQKDIQEPYILITHNGVFPMPGPYTWFLDDPNLIAWFSHNVENVSHPKLFCIPDGVPNQYQKPHTLLKIMYDFFKESNEKEFLCYLNISTSTYPHEREKVVEMFSSLPFVTKSDVVSYSQYILNLMKSKFVISPRGRGLDCFRHWESLYVGAIPIIKNSSLDPLFQDLPVLIINDWEEINEEFLNNNYEKLIKRKFNKERLNLEFWIQQIYNIKERFHEENAE